MDDTPHTQVMEPLPQSQRPWRRIVLLLLFCSVSALQLSGLFASWDSSSRVRDWVVKQAEIAATRQAVLDHHEVPAWNPWRCGGSPQLADPNVDAFSPWLPVQLMLGITPSIRVFVFLHLLFAMLGMWLWARSRGLSEIAALGAALCFGLAGSFSAFIAWGYTFMLPAVYLPLVMYSYERSKTHWLMAFASGALIALMLLEGGLQIALMTVLLLVLRTALDLRGNWRRPMWPLLTSMLALLVACGLSAPKLFSSIALINSFPLGTAPRDTLLLSQLLQMFMDRNVAHRAVGFTLERFEYFAYIGPLVFLSALWCVWNCRRQPYRELSLIIGLIAFLMIGDHGPWMPYQYLVQVPWLRWLLWVPSRLSVVIVVFATLSFAYALDAARRYLLRRWRHRFVHIALTVVVVAVCIDLMMVAHAQWHNNPFSHDPIVQQDKPFRVERGDRASMFALQQENAATILCHKSVPYPVSSALRQGSQPVVWLDSASHGDVKLQRMTTSRLRIHLDLNQASIVYINQNWQEGWFAHSDLDVKASKRQGLLSVAAPAGSGTVELRYQAPGMRIGLACLVFTLLLFVLALLVDRRIRLREYQAARVSDPRVSDPRS